MATSIITLHAFSGTNEDDPPCYLLKIDDFQCLLDCGWDSNFSDQYIHQVSKYIKNINAVVISHSDIRHLGALPYLFGKCGLNCPIYTTGPVYEMGHLSLYDAYLAKLASDDEFDLFSLDDIDKAFAKVVPLKYQQTKNLQGKYQGVTIIPFLAGHMLGGAMWKIVKDDIEIVYALDYNQKKEHHLNGATYDHIQRPHLLITGSYASQKSQRSQREENLKKTIHSTLRNNGNVLFLTDTAGRALELLYLLEQFWHDQQSGLMAYGLVNLNHVAANVNESAKSNLECMSEKMTQSFQMQSKPFEFRYTRLCHSLDDLSDVPDPKVIVTSQSHLNYGFGRDLFTRLCGDERNQIVLTSREREQCLSTELMRHISERSKSPGPFNVTLKERPKPTNADLMCRIAPELIQLSDVALINQSSKTLAIEDVDNDSESDNDDEEVKVEKMDWEHDTNTDPLLAIQDESNSLALSSEVNGVHYRSCDIYPSLHAKSGGQWFRSHNRMNLLFPSQEYKNQWDEYGEPINVKDANFVNTPGSVTGMRAVLNKPNSNNSTNIQSKNRKRMINEQSLVCMTNNFIKSLTNRDDQLVRMTASSREITVNCSVIFHDFEGRCEISSLSQMICGCKPMEIIVVGGSKTESANLVRLCRTNEQLKDSLFHIPDNGFVVNCTKEGNIYQARMSDGLVSSLTLHKVSNYDLSWIEAVVKDDAVYLDDNDGGNGIDELNKITTLEPPEGPIPEHNTIFINEPKLADIKQILIRQGLDVNFICGSLVVEKCVAIKKSEQGKLTLVGSMGKTYFDVRKVLHSQFAIL